MKFIKDVQESDARTTTLYVPMEPSPWLAIMHVHNKENDTTAIIFEANMIIDQMVPDYKVVNGKQTNQIIQRQMKKPYQVVVTSPEAIEQFVTLAESNLAN